MKSIPRKQANSAVGVSITNTSMNFIEFKATNGELELGSFGQVGIAFDAVEGGTIESIKQLTESVRTLRGKTSTAHLVFPSWGDTAQDEAWKEVFAIGGFENIVAVPQAQLIDILTRAEDGSSLPTLYWNPNKHLQLFEKGTQLLEVEYPLTNVDDIFALQDLVQEKYQDEVLVMIGQGPNEDPDETTKEMQEIAIPVRWANIWKNCLSIASKVPPIPYRQAFAYSQAIASALGGARYTFQEEATDTADTKAQPTQTPTPEKQEPKEDTAPAIQGGALSSALAGAKPTQASAPQAQPTPEPTPEPASPVAQPTPTQEATKPKPRAGSLQDALEKKGELPTMTPEAEPGKSPQPQSPAKPQATEATPQQEEGGEGSTNPKRSVWLQETDNLIKKLTKRKK